MEKPLFSIIAIALNEANTLPRFFKSLEKFQSAGGEVVICDTGSTDNTVQIAKENGAKVIDISFPQEQKSVALTREMRDTINRTTIKNGEQPIFRDYDGTEYLFHFAKARNICASHASNSFVLTMDCDEAYTNLDIEKINSLIREGVQKLEYQFVYAHGEDGRPAVQFVQSKAYDRNCFSWTGVVHEVLVGEGETRYVGPEHILLEHFQEPGKEHRGNYLKGLAVDKFLNPLNDRQTHYFARELMYTGRWHSALSMFSQHVSMDRWPAEKAQSLIYMGDCYGHINDPESQVRSYLKAYDVDPARREALVKLALFYKHNNEPRKAAAAAGAALQLPWVDYYANDRRHYEDLPHSVLYWAKGWMGDIHGAQQHMWECFKYSPNNPEYWRDAKYYFEYPGNNISGWMTFEELQWLYNTAKGKKEIVEVGSWKGRSTHALASGAQASSNPEEWGTVHCVDTWEGSVDPRDDTNWLAKQEDVFAAFLGNTQKFDNIFPHKGKSTSAALTFEDKSLDMVFIDAGHTKEEVLEDIKAWFPKVKVGGIICGHDYMPSWMGVIEAVDIAFGKGNISVNGTIWSYERKFQ